MEEGCVWVIGEGGCGCVSARGEGGEWRKGERV